MTWYEIENSWLIDTPALLLYRSRVQQNIDTALSLIKNPQLLRPHIKTNKSMEVCRMMMAAGIEKFKCATIAEAELLGIIKAKDVLLAYQLVGPKVKRFSALRKKFADTRFSCLVDNIESAKELSAASDQEDVAVWIDINTGMNRTGVEPARAADLLDDLLKLPGIVVVGIHIYDGHLVDSDFAMRKRKSDEGFEKTIEFQSYFTKRTGLSPSIVAGGSPTFRTHIGRGVECSPGTFVLWDMGYTNLFADEPFITSAIVITRIVSIVNSMMITVDLGYKSVASENPLPRVYFLNCPDAKPFFQNEEHLVIEVPDSKQFKPGDILYAVPEHICPTVALYDEAVVIDNNQSGESWEIAGRKRKISC
jgi:D-threonine aldolase